MLLLLLSLVVVMRLCSLCAIFVYACLLLGGIRDVILWTIPERLGLYKQMWSYIRISRVFFLSFSVSLCLSLSLSHSHYICLSWFHLSLFYESSFIVSCGC